VQVWTTFLACWMMPIIFVISGASTFYALGSRTVGKFVRDRAARLLVPLAVGCFTHIALQVYFERVSFSGFKGSFFDFYPQYFKGFYGFGGNFAWMGLHLWYLEALFLVSMLCLPLLLFLQGQAGEKTINAINHFGSKSGAIYLLALAPMALMALLNPNSQWGQRSYGGWPLIIYVFYFMYGFLIVGCEQVEKRIERLRWVSLSSALGIFLALLVLWKSAGDPKFGTPRYAFLLSLFALSSWCFILGFLGLCKRYLSFTTSFVKYSNEAVLPFYVLHQTIILVVGFFVVRWLIPDILKFVVISAVSFVLIVATYEFAIRRNNWLRFLFGMKARVLGPSLETPASTRLSSPCSQLQEIPGGR